MTDLTGFIAVHCGAGYHRSNLHAKYRRACRKACIVGGNVLKAGGSAIDACQVAIMVLEDNPLLNAGFGSSLTRTGVVECDASVMDGESLNFGACGAVRGVKYPISLATQICKDQQIAPAIELVPPSLLVGEGAHEYAKNSHLILINNKKLVSKRAYTKYKKYRHVVKSENLLDIEERLDTVGAVCVDGRGHVASGCSSGGIFLKYNGRVGSAATYASGVWADSTYNRINNTIAVTTSGTGEYLVKTHFAQELANSIRDSSCPVTTFYKCFKDKFLESRYLTNIPEKLAGALVLHVTPNGYGELLWGHSSQTMGFGYMDIKKLKVITDISQLSKDLVGINSVVSGVNFKINIP